MDNTLRALNDLSATDRKLRDETAPAPASVNELQERRAALRQAIPGVILVTYDALDRMGRRPIAVPVRNSHCGGCYLRLPPQLAAAVRHREALRTCPHCRRLLYSPAPEETGTGDERQPEPEPKRSAEKTRPSKRLRRIPGRRTARKEQPAAGRREPRRV